jgi:glutaconyl-CoA/methylmalonyl-CoA decarboxylase subunit gamma
MRDTLELRLTVSGAADLVTELSAGGNARLPVRPLPTAADEAALGRRRFEVVVDGWRFEVVAEPARRAALRERAQHAAALGQGSAAVRLRAQIPGRVTRLWVSEGEQVERGQRLLAIEAMKMENEIRAPRAGTVAGIAVAVGGLVELKDELLTIG